MMTTVQRGSLADPRGSFRQLEAVDAALCRVRRCILQREDALEHMDLVRLARAVLIWRRTLEGLCEEAAKPEP